MIWMAFLGASLSVCLGYGLATYFARRTISSMQKTVKDQEEDALSLEVDPEQARKFLAKLQKLAVSVDDDVGRHASRIAEINLALDGAGTGDASAVLAAATHLVQANRLLQADLELAKSEIQVQQQKLDAYMTEARTDPLTGLANRRAFDQELKRRFAEWKRRGTPVSLLLIDVDHFKKVNDQYGHHSGDAVLRGVGAVLTDTMRDMDVVARYGGEEFAVILPGTNLAGAQPAAERVRIAIEGYCCQTLGVELQVTASLGVSVALENDDPESLVKRADESLYAAKDGGRNCAWYHNGEACHQVEAQPGVKARYEYNAVQRIAPFVDGRFPESSLFCDVECEDITPTGFSFLVEEQPEYDYVILAWQTGSDVAYMTASIKSRWNIGTDIDPLIRVECEFTARADLRRSAAPLAAAR